MSTAVPPIAPVEIFVSFRRACVTREDECAYFPVAEDIRTGRKRSMTHLSPTQAEAHLQQVAEQFTQWRQSRPSVRGSRIPATLWTEVLALVEVFAVPRVAKALHLKPQALKRRQSAPGPQPLPPACGVCRSRADHVASVHGGSRSPAARWDPVADHV